jgi:hypothetical protein
MNEKQSNKDWLPDETHVSQRTVPKGMFGQPRPTTNNNPAVWEEVIKDMQARDSFGRQKYGTPLQAFNGRDALRDAYEESLDLCVYLRQALYERDKA